MIKKLLIANRGEIAVRVIRAAKEMGILTVAVYSEADSKALHTQLADEAVFIGPSESSQSYLVIDKIISAAKETGANAIHPGYGFLSERAEFAEACAEAGIIFVGPPPAAMRALGEKIDAKAIAVANQVPITPGLFDRSASPEQLLEAAKEIGFPVMLKASAGGGGRGMRIVRGAASFLEEFKIASDEALKAFGDGAMMVEKLIERPRHVEVQIIADQHGQVVPLFERECSIQRRHQKLIEEATSPAIEKAPDLWPAMREASIRLIQAAGYFGAGTIEFMVDEADGKFYFLEVNARLQVEHPVTELITGTDLVQWQLRIASGEKIDLPEGLMKGDRSAIGGHSIEARVVAEDPSKGFLPSSGRLLAWAEPKAPGVRVDTGYGPGGEIPRFYDSLIAKVIVHAPTRTQAIARLREALQDFHILGVKTNISYLLDVLAHPSFASGDFDTGFLGREFSEWNEDEKPIPDELGAIFASASQATSNLAEAGKGTANRDAAWSILDSWRLTPS